MSTDAIEVTGLIREYREGTVRRRVLDGVDLRMPAGGFGALMGPSGSGKSTLLYALGAMDRVDGGSIRVAGVTLDGLDEDARTRFRRRHVGFVFQDFNLIPTLTVLENLILPLELNGHAARTAAAQARGWLERLGLEGRGTGFPEQLSGGERQRVAVARSLIHKPTVVLADEPTGSLDGRTAEQVLEALDTLRRDAGSTLLVATHSTAVAAWADQVFQVGEGRVVPTRLR